MVNLETPEKIHLAISKKISTGVSYIDALVDYAKEKGVEIETIAEIVKKSSILKEKVKEEAIQAKLVKQDNDVATIC